MNTKRKLNKAALIFAILSIIAFAVAIAPGVLAIFLSVAALLITLFGLLVFVLGGLVALIMLAVDPGVWASVSALGSESWQLAFNLFKIVPPMTTFWFSTPAQICTGIGIGVGVIAIILASVALSNKQPRDDANSDADTTEDPFKDAKADERQKKHKRKNKTARAASITCLVLGIVFTVLNVIALVAIFIIF